MSVQTVVAGNAQIQIESVAPAGQVSTGSYVVLAGTEIDARSWRTVAYTIGVITQSVYWKVFAANASDYSDEVEVKAETSVAASGVDSYAVSPAPYSYYRVKIKSNSGAGTATVRGVAKR